MNKLFSVQIKNPIFKIAAVVLLVLLVWWINIIFLSQASKWGMNGHDWEYLLYYDSFRGNELDNFSRIRADLGNPYFTQIVYYLGTLKQVFGLDQTTFKLVDIFWKSLAALSSGWLAYKLTKEKLFALLAIFFFTIFPSTAGPLNFIMSGINFLIIPFMCLSVYFYIQSAKNPKKILLASLFFYLALIAGPARAYLILPVPFFIELFRLRRSFKPFVFLRRLAIFYLVPYLTLQSNTATFNPMHEVLRHIKLVADGNLYTFSMPFQMISTLFVDQSILKSMSTLMGFIVINIILLVFSVFLGYVVFGKQQLRSFAFKVLIPTLLLEGIFYFLGLLSSNFTGKVPFLDPEGRPYLIESLNPTIFQVAIGGYIFILGLNLALEWWRNQRANKTLMVIVGAWFWLIFSELEMFLTSYRWEMIYESNDRYIVVCSLGAVIFAAGIFALSFKALTKLRNLNIRRLSISLLMMTLLLIVWKDYEYLHNFFYNWNEIQGGSAYWQDTMYHRFLNKFGKENLSKPIFLYIDMGVGTFNQGSFYNLLGFRIFYDENGNLIRDNCKVVINDINIAKKTYTVNNNGEKGFLYETKCIAPYISTVGKQVFYPLSNFYAYRMKNKDFIDIKDEVISHLDETIPQI